MIYFWCAKRAGENRNRRLTRIFGQEASLQSDVAGEDSQQPEKIRAGESKGFQYRLF
jgi:hypothetical protein